jgi:4,5-dihydroxyphthalate decarboxylase
MVVIREDVYRKNPWIAASLFDAFERAKRWAMDMMRMNHAQRVMLPWLYDDLDEVDELFGGDPWSYGVEPNRKTLETLIRNMTDQGLLLNKVTVDQLFVPVEA